MVDDSACGSMGDMNLSPDGEFREYKLSCCEAVPKLVAPLPRLAVGLEGDAVCAPCNNFLAANYRRFSDYL